MSVANNEPIPALGEQSPTQVFLSYARNDEGVLHFIEKFREHLTYFAFANRGRRIKVFLDSQSIVWGEDWRDKVYQSVQGASAFIPLVTIEYLNRPMCREELLLFVESAEKLGVTELFLPVVILGKSMISEDSDNIAARHIASRQYRDLQEAVFDGTDSATWRKAMYAITNDLVDAIERAESYLEEHAEETLEAADDSLDLPFDERPDDAPSLQEIYDSAASDVEQFGPLMSDFSVILNDFAEKSKIFEGGRLDDNPSAKQVALLKFAKYFTPQAHKAEGLGNAIEQRVMSADHSIREVKRLLSLYGTDDMKKSFTDDLDGAMEFLETIEEAQANADVALKQFKSVEMLNVPLRKAIRPLRRAINSASAALGTLLSWKDLGRFD